VVFAGVEELGADESSLLNYIPTINSKFSSSVGILVSLFHTNHYHFFSILAPSLFTLGSGIFSAGLNFFQGP
jgi:hypothetical protein